MEKHPSNKRGLTTDRMNRLDHEPPGTRWNLLSSVMTPQDALSAAPGEQRSQSAGQDKCTSPERDDASGEVETESTTWDADEPKTLRSAQQQITDVESGVDADRNMPLQFQEIKRVLDIVSYQINLRISDGRMGDQSGFVNADIVALRADRDSLPIVYDLMNPNGRGLFTVHAGPRNEGESHTAYLTRSIIAQVQHLKASIPSGSFREPIAEDGTIRLFGHGARRFAADPKIISQQRVAELIYMAARARQIVEKLESRPDEVRTTVLEADDPDASWLVNDPVVFKQSRR